MSQRVYDCALQEWQSSVWKNKRLILYGMFKDNCVAEPYLTKVKCKKFRSALARLRCSSHCLEIEIGRKHGIDMAERVCKFCLNTGNNNIESEYHFVLVCPLYDELKTQVYT